MSETYNLCHKITFFRFLLPIWNICLLLPTFSLLLRDKNKVKLACVCFPQNYTAKCKMKDPEEHPVKSRRPLQKSAERRRRCRRRSQCKIEKLQEAELDSHLGFSSATCKSLVFHQRPGFGQLGTKCVIKANHFLADISVSDLSHYNVSL